MQNVELQPQYGLYINGKWRPSGDGKYFKVHCPANGEQLAECAEATREDVDAAVTAANTAWKTWKNVDPIVRADLLLKIADVIDANKEHLAMVESMDNGKAIRETLNADIPLSADHFRYFAGAIRTEEGSAAMLDKNTMSLVLREPIGVVGQIVPWNFPLLMSAWKLAPVLASGCCTVLKPSSLTPLSALELARLIGPLLPPGVFNVVTGKGSRAGQYMLEHNGFNKLAFTGSTEVGLSVADAASQHLIPATLELGGKSANIFFPDCDWDLAMDGLQLGILFNQGQVCCAGSRVFVHEDIYDKFMEDAVKAFNKIKVGMPWLPATQMGCQIDKSQVKKIQEKVDAGVKEGAVVACG
ncbi:MAG: aldehyde dehydrogenase family protein, partial [Cloacibacillus sp.]